MSINDNDNIDSLGLDGFDPMAIPGSRRISSDGRRTKAAAERTEPRSRRVKAADPEPAAQPRRKKKTADARPAWLRFFADKRTQRAFGVLLVILAAVIFMATLSHLHSGAADQSAIEGKSISAIAAEGAEVQNVGGPAGAKFSQWLFADGLGMGAFAIVVWLALLGIGLLRLIKVSFWSLTAKCLFSAVALSIVCGLVFYRSDSYIHWGGAHGRFANEWLMSVGHVLLAVAVSVALVGVAACIFFNELATLYHKVAGTVTRKREAWRRSREEERARRADITDIEEPAEDHTEESTDAFCHGAESLPEHSEPEHKKGTVAGFDIDDDTDDAEESEFAPRKSSLETTLPDDSSVEEPALPEPAQDRVGDATDFVVHSADSDEAFSIDEDCDEADELADSGGMAQEVLDSEPFDPRAELSRYRFPDVDLLIARDSAPVVDMEEQRANKDLIVKTLLDYKIPIERIEATVGPTVTLYEVKPAEGIRVAQIKRLEDDIARSLSALGVRIIAPIPGKDVVGLEVPNRDPQIVSIRNVLGSRKFRECEMRLPMAIGATISNDIFIADLAKMPHLLVAGATGQGKSVGLNCILASLLYKMHPSELKFVLIDPKMVEFSLYSKLERHYLAKLPDEEEAIVTDPLKAAATLHSLCIEMDNRYQLLRKANVRNLEEYNEKFRSRRLNPEQGHCYMPYIVMVVDEFADLIMQAGKDVSQSIARIAQKARAVGMHMIIATQRPSTDVISGMIKNNFPGRIAFKVSQMVDSRTILDSPGANRLIGRGDMLFSHNSAMTRVQCALIETSEVEAIVDHINDQIGYPQAYLLPEIPQEGGAAADMGGMVDLSKRDAMFNECARFIISQSTASTSMLQRRFGIGYNKAGKIMDQMEAAGIVGPACGSKPRAILVDSISLEQIIDAG